MGTIVHVKCDWEFANEQKQAFQCLLKAENLHKRQIFEWLSAVKIDKLTGQWDNDLEPMQQVKQKEERMLFVYCLAEDLPFPLPLPFARMKEEVK